MAGAEDGECSGEFIQVVRDGDGGERGGLLGRQDNGLLGPVCCVCGPFGGHSQPFGVLFGALGRLLCLIVRGHGVGHLGVEGRQVSVGFGELVPLLAQCEELVPGPECADLLRGPGVCGLCCLVNLGRLGEGAGGGSEVGVEGGNARRDLHGGQRLLLCGQFVETVAGTGDVYLGLLEVGESSAGEPGLQLAESVGTAGEVADPLLGRLVVTSEGRLKRGVLRRVSPGRGRPRATAARRRAGSRAGWTRCPADRWAWRAGIRRTRPGEEQHTS